MLTPSVRSYLLPMMQRRGLSELILLVFPRSQSDALRGRNLTVQAMEGSSISCLVLGSPAKHNAVQPILNSPAMAGSISDEMQCSNFLRDSLSLESAASNGWRTVNCSRTANSNQHQSGSTKHAHAKEAKRSSDHTYRITFRNSVPVLCFGVQNCVVRRHHLVSTGSF